MKNYFSVVYAAELVRVLVLFLAASGLLQAHDVRFTFTYDFTTNPACTATLTTSCVSHFEAEIWSEATPTAPAAVLVNFTVPLPASPVGLMEGILHLQTGVVLPTGHYLLTLKAAKRAPSGGIVYSGTDQCGLFVPIPKPSKLAGRVV